MKCPFRVKKKITYNNCKDYTTEEIFADCYEEECPFYKKVKEPNSNKEKIICKKEKSYR